MIFLKKKDIINIYKYNKIELYNNINKFLFINLLNSKIYSNIKKSKLLYLFLKKKYKYKKHKSTIVLRCKQTNRGRGIFRPFNISRLMLKEMIHNGLVPGYKKAVW